MRDLAVRTIGPTNPQIEMRLRNLRRTLAAYQRTLQWSLALTLDRLPNLQPVVLGCQLPRRLALDRFQPGSLRHDLQLLVVVPLQPEFPRQDRRRFHTRMGVVLDDGHR